MSAVTGTRFPALGTTAHLLVTDPAALADAESLLGEFLADLDVACSRFRADSSLSTVNRLRTVTGTHPLLVAALQVALDAARDTDGLVDPTLGRQLVSIGYDRRFAVLPRNSAAPVRSEAAGDRWRRVELDATTNSIALPDGARLDLGATAKAWAADVAAAQVADRLGCGVLVNLGGDLAVAGQAPSRGWRIRVTDDHTARIGGQVVTIRSGGLATSSTTLRTWRRAGQVLHHVLDPATGLPARRIWRCVSVSAASCVAANTAATAALVLGERAVDWLAARDLPARLQAVDGTITRLHGWPTDLPEPSTVEVA